jgi:hypothetical protein
MRVCVYTTLFDDYDTLFPINFETAVEFIVFSRVPIFIKGWRNIVIDSPKSSLYLNRYFKFQIGDELCEYDILAYVDASIIFVRDPYDLVISKLSSGQLYLSKHPLRNNYLEEAKSCITVGADLSPKVLSAIRFLKEVNASQDMLYECGFLISKNHDENLKKMFGEWFDLWCKYSIRDQLYAPYLMSKYDINLYVEGQPLYRGNSTFLKLVGHTKKLRKFKKIIRILKNFTVNIFCSLAILRAR